MLPVMVFLEGAIGLKSVSVRVSGAGYGDAVLLNLKSQLTLYRAECSPFHFTEKHLFCM